MSHIYFPDTSTFSTSSAAANSHRWPAAIPTVHSRRRPPRTWPPNRRSAEAWRRPPTPWRATETPDALRPNASATCSVCGEWRASGISREMKWYLLFYFLFGRARRDFVVDVLCLSFVRQFGFICECCSSIKYAVPTENAHVWLLCVRHIYI